VISSAVHFTVAHVPLAVVSRQVAASFARARSRSFSLRPVKTRTAADWLLQAHPIATPARPRWCGKIEGLGWRLRQHRWIGASVLA